MRLRIASVIVMLVVALPASAPLVCYSDDVIPIVRSLHDTPDGLVATLGGKFGQRRAMLFDGTAWHEATLDVAALGPRSETCPKEFGAKRYVDPEESEFSGTTETVCATSARFVYGGITFYAGEGQTGTGGLLRFDTKTRRVELRRLRMLRDVSVNSIAAEGNVVWFGTTEYGECVGDPFVHGLVRYDWSTREVTTYEGSDDGPLGFVINDILLSPETIWVATDLGVSRLDRADGTWHHYMPYEHDGCVAAPELPARAIATILLDTTPREALMNESFENQLVEGFALFRPRLLREYLQSKPATEWHCPELRFLGSRMADYDSFRRRLLPFASPGSERFSCAAEGFARERHVEPEWRDLAVATWKAKPGSVPPAAFRWFRGDREVAELLAASRDPESIAVIPQVLGEASVPLLAPIIESYTPDTRVRYRQIAAVYALELATHRRIDPDGHVELLPDGSNQPWYAEEASLHRYYDERAMRWSAAEESAVVMLWKAWLRDNRAVPNPREAH
ncbi:MAG: hypothetical protein WC538_02320 [Thermoanaerobaculia bacterium]|jgi:hypothetical protein